MSIFAEFENLISESVDEYFGDKVTLYPRARGEVGNSADGTRSIIVGVGVVDFNPHTILAKGKKQYDAFQPNLSGEKIHVSFDDGVFPDIASRPKSGDRLKAELKSGDFILEVVDVLPDELGRFICTCKHLPGASV